MLKVWVAPKPVQVEIGLFNNKFIEIKSGLNTGDRVLLAPPIDSSIDLDGAVIHKDEEVDLEPSGGVSQPDRSLPNLDQHKEQRPRGDRGKKRPPNASDS